MKYQMPYLATKRAVFLFVFGVFLFFFFCLWVGLAPAGKGGGGCGWEGEWVVYRMVIRHAMLRDS